MSIDLSSFCFPSIPRTKSFALIITDIGELIFSGHTIEMTVYANAQLIFALV